MPDKKAITIKVDPDIMGKLKEICKHERRSYAEQISKWIQDYKPGK